MADVASDAAVLERQREQPELSRRLDQRFEFGLDCLLDGIGMRIDSCR